MIGRRGTLGIAAAMVALLAPASARAVPHLAGNERGDRVLLYQVLSQRDRPLFAAAAAPGQPFGPLSTAAPSPFEEPRVAIDGAGGAVTVWRAGGQGLSAPVMAAVRPPGGAFGAPVQLSPPGQRAEDVRLAVNGRGDAVAYWYAFDYRDMYSFKPAGGTFSSAAEVPGRRAREVRVAIEAGGGVLFLRNVAAHQGEDPGRPLPYETVYRRPDGTFESPKELPGLERLFLGLHAAIGSSPRGDVLVAWLVGNEIHAIERPAGGDFGPEFVVARGVRDDDGNRYAIALADSGDAVVTYGGRPLEAVIRRGRGSFSPPQTLGSGVFAAAVTMNARGDAAAVWANGSRNVYGAYAPAGSGFGAGTLLASVPFGVAGAFAPPLVPDVTIDAVGHPTAVWEESDGETVRVQSRGFDRAGPGPLTPVATVGAFEQVAPASACTPPGATVVARSSRSAVVRWGPAIYLGCLLGRGTPVRLNQTYPLAIGYAGASGPHPPPAMALAGPFVASVLEVSNHWGPGSTYVNLIDLRDEHSGINRATPARPARRYKQADSVVVPVVKLRPDGAMAWIVCARPVRVPFSRIPRPCRRPGGPEKLLYAWELASSTPRLLARSKRIDPRTLKLSGSTLTWKAGKRHRAATLR